MWVLPPMVSAYIHLIYLLFWKINAYICQCFTSCLQGFSDSEKGRGKYKPSFFSKVPMSTPILSISESPSWGGGGRSICAVLNWHCLNISQNIIIMKARIKDYPRCLPQACLEKWSIWEWLPGGSYCMALKHHCIILGGVAAVTSLAYSEGTL